MTGPSGGSPPAATPATGAAGGAAQQPEQEAPPPAFPDVEAWVTGHFLPMFRRTLGGEFRWCAEWWRHAEAISRLTALWRAWETFRIEPATGIADWYREHLDHHLPILLGPRGPFYQCSEEEHLDARPPRCIPVPPGWLDPGLPPEDGWPDGTWDIGGDSPAGSGNRNNDRPPGHAASHPDSNDPGHSRRASR